MEGNIPWVENILREGAQRASQVASSTMAQVREAMKLGVIS